MDCTSRRDCTAQRDAQGFTFPFNALRHRDRGGAVPTAIPMASRMTLPFLGNLIGGLIMILSAWLLINGILPSGTEALLSGLVLVKEAGSHAMRGVAGRPLHA
jgi:hypothetical protein